MGITVQLKITSQVTKFIKQILSFWTVVEAHCEDFELHLFSRAPIIFFSKDGTFTFSPIKTGTFGKKKRDMIKID
jgi:hypothetical protein